MPTTFTGLLLFVVLLLPGFAYMVGRERHGVQRRVSALRETVSIVAASITAELMLLALTAVIWANTIDVGDALGNPRAHAAALISWGCGLLIAASAITYLWSWPRPRRAVDQFLSQRFTGRWSCVPDMIGTGYPHPSTVSAWWRVLRERRDEIHAEYGRDPVIRVGCYLDDGSYIEGGLNSFSQLADETADRDLILAEPHHRPCAAVKLEPLDAHAAVVSARRIVAMQVKYYFASPEPASAPLVPEVGGADEG